MQVQALKKLSIAAIVAAAFCSSTIHAQSNSAPTASAAKKSGQAATVSADDQKLMKQLAQANMAEVASAELAQTKSSNEQVLKFSKQMIDDHTAAQKDLAKLAEEKNVALPKETDAKHKDALKNLNQKKSADFDREYIAMAAMADHQDAVKLVGKIASDAKDPDLKALGKKLLPTIENHLKMAKELKAS